MDAQNQPTIPHTFCPRPRHIQQNPHKEGPMKYVVTVRGRLKHRNEQEARAAHDAVVDKLSPIGRSMGSTGHRAYLNAQDRGQFMATDYWDSLEATQTPRHERNTKGPAPRGWRSPPTTPLWVEAGWKG